METLDISIITEKSLVTDQKLKTTKEESKLKSKFSKLLEIGGILLSLADVVTDIIQLINYYSLGFKWYFSIQLSF